VDDLINYLSAHPVILVIAIAVALLLIYFLFREMLKVLLITSLVAIVLGLIALYGYYHGTSDQLPRNVRETVDRVGDQRERVGDVGRAVIEKGRELVEKVGESMRERRSREEE